MDIYVYSDESGVFDKAHNKYFVFGGVLFLNKDERDVYSRKYIAAERVIRNSESIKAEVKATTVSNKSKGKLYRSLNQVQKFGVVIRERSILDRIFESKKDKQRYLDYAYKIGIKRKFQQLIDQHVIMPGEVKNIYFNVDEHTTATNGKYELREALEQEFKLGTYNWNYNTHYSPIFSDLNGVDLQFCNSEKVVLVRAADIVANRIYYLANQEQAVSNEQNKLLISILP